MVHRSILEDLRLKREYCDDFGETPSEQEDHDGELVIDGTDKRECAMNST
jgi:hypothetical protein